MEWICCNFFGYGVILTFGANILSCHFERSEDELLSVEKNFEYIKVGVTEILRYALDDTLTEKLFLFIMQSLCRINFHRLVGRDADTDGNHQGYQEEADAGAKQQTPTFQGCTIVPST